MRHRHADSRELAHLNALRVRLDWLGLDAMFVSQLAELHVSHPKLPGGPIAVGVTGRGSYVLADGAYRRAIVADPHEAARRLVAYFHGRLVRV